MCFGHSTPFTHAVDVVCSAVNVLVHVEVLSQCSWAEMYDGKLIFLRQLCLLVAYFGRCIFMNSSKPGQRRMPTTSI